MSANQPPHLTVRMPRLPKTGIIFNLQPVHMVWLGVALGIVVISSLLFELQGILLTTPIWLPIALVGFSWIRDMPAPTVITRSVIFMFRRAKGQTKYRHRPDSRALAELRAEGYMVLPGRKRNVRLLSTHEEPQPGRNSDLAGAAIIHDTATNLVTVVAEILARPFLTGSIAQQDALVQGYAGMHRAWTLRKGIYRITELERTRVGSTRATAEYRDQHWRAPEAAEGLTESYDEALELAAHIVREHVTQIAFTFDIGELREQIRRAGGGDAGLATVLMSEMKNLQHAGLEAGFRSVRWLTPGEVRATIRMQLDPAEVPSLQARAATGDGEVAPGGEAVMSLEEARDFVRTDSGHHRVWWISQWPHHEVRPGILERIITGGMADGSVIRHTLAVVKTPVPIGRALERINKRKRAWTASERVRVKQGRITSEADKQEWQALIEQEQDLVAGMGEFELSAYLTISAESRDELDQASSAMHTHMANAGLEAHILYNQQTEGLFMCAIPTGEGLA